MRVTQSIESDAVSRRASIRWKPASIQTQNQMSQRRSRSPRLRRTRSPPASQQLQPGLGAKPAIHHQRQQRTNEFEHRGQRAVAGAKPIAEPCAPWRWRPIAGTLDEHRSHRHRAASAQIQNSLLDLANTQNGNGEYIFSGFATQTQPFTLDRRRARPTTAIRASGRCRSRRARPLPTATTAIPCSIKSRPATAPSRWPPTPANTGNGHRRRDHGFEPGRV